MLDVLNELLPIFLLLGVTALVLWRLPKIDLGHSAAFLRRRRLNWVTLGFTYAFLYFGRYNLSVAKTELDAQGLMSNEIFGNIFAVGSIVYGCSFLINGPLCDRFGGRITIIIAAIGASIANLLMGLFLIYRESIGVDLPLAFTVLYAINMYFQSFGAVSIVKVNSAWFHVRERGMIGGIFGILISLGLYFAYDWNRMILDHAGVNYVFLIPSAVLLLMFFVAIFIVRDTPSRAGHEDFNTADATSDYDGPPMRPIEVFKKLLTNPIILTIAAIEFCSGFIRNAIMQWGPTVSKLVPVHSDDFVFQNWGMVSCIAGILSGMFAGVISDYVFKSRRGPVAAILYAGLLAGCVVLFFVLDNFLFGITFAFMSLCVIGVHGMLSGTATMDFGGSKNAGIATGVIDACVYLGSGLQAFVLGRLLPDAAADGREFAANPENWYTWPLAMLPFIVIGLIFSIKIWNATVEKSKEPQALSA
ncbi:MAG: MFS transporter [Bradymonadales bacterium]|jgi:OPA family glycerol-3-phosphate transporter-like MFS transporter